MNQIEKDIKRCFIETFKQIDEEFLKLATKKLYQIILFKIYYFSIESYFYSKPVWKDGTTVTIVIIINDILYAANLGDSKVCGDLCD